MRSLFEPEIALKPLRGRQIGVIPELEKAVRDGHKRIIVQAPTGSGKTILAAHLMDRSVRKGRRPIFVCPAIALVEQTLLSFEEQGIKDIGIIQAQHQRTDFRAQVQIASRDTLVRRPVPEIHFAVVDEVHDGRESFDAILDSEGWKDKIIIGLSATPWSKGLGLRWTKLIVMSTIQQMIDEGWLAPFRVFGPADGFEPNMKGIKTIGGEFQEGATSKLMQDVKLVGDAVETWLRHRQEGRHPGDRTFLYGVDRAHAKALMEAFNAQGISAGYIDGNSTPQERLTTFQRYRTRQDKIMCNVGVLITGVDEDVRCIQDCAPTKSQIRHVQKIGRGLRLADGKQFLLVLDHGGNNGRLGLVTDIYHDTLDTRTPQDKGEAYQADAEPAKPRKCRKCHALIPPKTRSCPGCGDVYQAPNRVEHMAGELIEIGSKPKKARKAEPTMTDKQDFYSGALAIAASRGRSSGWVAHLYREKFGVWPRGLLDMPRPPTKEVVNFELSRRIAYAKAREKASSEVRA